MTILLYHLIYTASRIEDILRWKGKYYWKIHGHAVKHASCGITDVKIG